MDLYLAAAYEAEQINKPGNEPTSADWLEGQADSSGLPNSTSESQCPQKRARLLRDTTDVNYLRGYTQYPISMQASVSYLGQLLLPFGLPSRFTSVIHFVGLPRPYARRCSTAMASAT
jgi:hypothetical protein